MLGRVLLHDLLTRRATTNGTDPFVTWYGLDPQGSSARTELSVRSFANWVAKTANLLTDELGLEPGERVELRLNHDYPGHWMTLIWTMAAWQAGLTVTDGPGDVVVTGPTPGTAPKVPGYACSLHPLGIGLRDLPPGWADFSTEVLAQPDDWFGPGPDSPDDLAWDSAERSCTLGELMTLPSSAGRVLLTNPTSAWDVAQHCLVAPLLGGGSTVITTDVDETATARIAQDEKVSP